VSESRGGSGVPRKIDAGEVLAALGGALVFVSLFLAWFDELSGWEAFEALDLVIAVLALVAVGAAASSVTGTGGPSARVLPWVGLLLVAIVAVQLIEPPPGALHLEVQSIDGDARFFEGDPSRDTGAWLALAGSALVLLGGILRLARISVTVSVGGRDVRKRVPAVDRRPAGAAAPPPAPDATPPTEPTQPVDPPPAQDPQATQPFSALEDR
jgi:hypothetical protein